MLLAYIVIQVGRPQARRQGLSLLGGIGGKKIAHGKRLLVTGLRPDHPGRYPRLLLLLNDIRAFRRLEVEQVAVDPAVQGQALEVDHRLLAQCILQAHGRRLVALEGHIQLIEQRVLTFWGSR